MPKAILEFNLPEDQDDFNLANSASKMFCALHDISHYARSLKKYEQRESIPTEEIVDELYKLIGQLPDVS